MESNLLSVKELSFAVVHSPSISRKRISLVAWWEKFVVFMGPGTQHNPQSDAGIR